LKRLYYNFHSTWLIEDYKEKINGVVGRGREEVMREAI